MIDWIHELRLSIVQAMTHIGLDPLYVIPLGVIAYAATLWRDYYCWWIASRSEQNLSKADRSWLGSVLLAVLASLLILLMHAGEAV